MTTHPRADWEAIRAAYIKRDIPVSGIADVFGVSRSAIWQRARREEWPKPKPAKAAGRSLGKEEPPHGKAQVSKPTRRKNRQQVKRQLLEVLAMQVERLERRIISESEMTSSDYEREARALNSLVRNFEALEVDDRAGELPAAPQKTETSAMNQANGDEADAHAQDTLRRALADRLTRLRAQLNEHNN
jgi:hypothetical protein